MLNYISPNEVYDLLFFEKGNSYLPNQIIWNNFFYKNILLFFFFEKGNSYLPNQIIWNYLLHAFVWKNTTVKNLLMCIILK